MRSSSGYVSRPLNTSGVSDLRAEFWVKITGWESGDEARFKVSPDNSTWYTVRTWNYSDSDNTYRFYNISLSAYPASTSFFVAFQAGMNQNDDYLYLDNLKLVGQA